MSKRISVFALIGLVIFTITACGGSDSVDDISGDSSANDAVASTSTLVVSTPTTVPTATKVPTPTVIPTAIPIATASPTPTVPPTATAVPTAVPTAVATVPPTSTTVPTVTPTVGPPTPIPTATPIGYSTFSGNGLTETEGFQSPPRLPWIIEWVAEGTGANSITVTLMDPDTQTEIIELVSDTGTGQIGGSNLVVGNMGFFYLKIDGPESGWTIWITQQ